MKKATIISVANQKGGVGKTTTVSEVAENLAAIYKRKVLMIDIDPQSSLTSIKSDMHAIITQNYATMSDVMMRQKSLSEIIIPVHDNLDIAPSTLLLSDVELNLVSTTMREMVLKKALALVEKQYDFIIIDCPPSRGLLTVNALSASDYVVVPVQAEYQALLGMQLLKNTITNVQKEINSDLKVDGYVVTMTSHTNHSNETIEGIKHDKYDTLIEIPRSIDVADAGVANLSTYAYNSDNKAGKKYLELSNHINDLRE